MYYLRTKPATQAIQFTLDPSKAGNRSSLKKKEEDSPDKEKGKTGLAKVAEIYGEACESCSG